MGSFRSGQLYVVLIQITRRITDRIFFYFFYLCVCVCVCVGGGGVCVWVGVWGGVYVCVCVCGLASRYNSLRLYKPIFCEVL